MLFVVELRVTFAGVTLYFANFSATSAVVTLFLVEFGITFAGETLAIFSPSLASHLHV